MASFESHQAYDSGPELVFLMAQVYNPNRYLKYELM